MQDSCQRSFIRTILFCYLNYIHYLGRWKSVVSWFMRNMYLVFHLTSGTKFLIVLEFPKCDKGIFCYVHRVIFDSSWGWGLVAYGVRLVIRWWELLVPTPDLWEGGKAEDEPSPKVNDLDNYVNTVNLHKLQKGKVRNLGLETLGGAERGPLKRLWGLPTPCPVPLICLAAPKSHAFVINQ